MNFLFFTLNTTMSYIPPYITQTELQACVLSVKMEGGPKIPYNSLKASQNLRDVTNLELIINNLNVDVEHSKLSVSPTRMQEIKRATNLVAAIERRNRKLGGIKYIFVGGSHPQKYENELEPFYLHDNVLTLRSLLTGRLNTGVLNELQRAIMRVNYVKSFIELMKFNEYKFFSRQTLIKFKKKLFEFIVQLYAVVFPGGVQDEDLAVLKSQIIDDSVFEGIYRNQVGICTAVNQFLATAQSAWIAFEADRISSAVFLLVLGSALNILSTTDKFSVEELSIEQYETEERYDDSTRIANAISDPSGQSWRR